MRHAFSLSAWPHKEKLEQDSKPIIMIFLKDTAKIKSMKNSLLQYYNRVKNIQEAWKAHISKATERKNALLAALNNQIEEFLHQLVRARQKNKKFSQFIKKIQFLSDKAKGKVVDDYLQACKLEHTIQLIRWYAIQNESLDQEALNASIHALL